MLWVFTTEAPFGRLTAGGGYRGTHIGATAHRGIGVYSPPLAGGELKGRGRYFIDTYKPGTRDKVLETKADFFDQFISAFHLTQLLFSTR